MAWEHYKTVDPLKREPQIGRRLFCVHLLILHFKFQFSKSIKSSVNISCFPQFNLSFQKNSQKLPKNLHKIAERRLMKQTERFSVV